MATSPDIAGLAVTAGSAVGRAFSVITLLPSLFLVGIVWALFAADAFVGAPSPDAFVLSVRQLSLGDVGLLVLAALALGYVLHPVQYAITQLLEGYWGTSTIGLALMRWRVLLYRRRHRELNNRMKAAKKNLREARSIDFDTEEADSGVVRQLIERQQVDIALMRLPVQAQRMMPTRLGNVLRRHEDLVGEPYGLPGVSVIPPLTLVAREESKQYLSESAEQVDAATSVCAVTAAATAVVVAATLTDGWWLLLALVPYGMSYLAYRGAVSAAAGYGLAMRHIVDLDRFALYRELHLPQPAHLGEERLLGEQVRVLLDPPAGMVLTRSGDPLLAGGRKLELGFETEPAASADQSPIGRVRRKGRMKRRQQRSQ